MSNYIIGIDIGTQGTKTSIYNENGICVGSHFQKSKLYQAGDGTVEEDPEEQLTSVLQTISSSVMHSKIDPLKVAGIAIAGQMAGVIGINKEGINITPYDSWLDTRCEPYIGKMLQAAGDEIASSTGNYPSYNHGPKILWWKHECPEVYKHIASFVQPGAYVAMRLCGLKADNAFIDYTYIHFSGFADNRNCSWNDNLCEEFQIDKQKLPQILPPQEIIGKITSEMALRCGLAEGTPVVAGCGDTAASFLSVGATREGICIDVAGTASVFATTTSEFVSDTIAKTLGCGQAVIKGLWHSYAYINGGGLNIDWFMKEIVGFRRDTNPISFEYLNDAASKLQPMPGDPVFVPYLGGRVCPPQPNVRGGWLNLNWSHSATNLYKATLESVALEYAVFLNILKKNYPSFKANEIRITGGGSKNALWNQIKADVLQVTLKRMTREDGAPLGAAVLAGAGVKLFPDLGKIVNQWVQTGATFTPDVANENLYLKKISLYEKFTTLISNYNFQS